MPESEKEKVEGGSNTPPDEKKAIDEPVAKNEDEKSPIEQAKFLVEENSKLLAAMTIERQKMEKVAASMMLEGRGFAGQIKHEETPEEKWAREAKLRYAGTGMDPT